MADSRCGLRCTGCGYKQAHHCGGCIETQGRPFHGACPVAQCCQNRGFSHCGQCPELPCALLWNYSCDPVHGDDPAGSRIVQCRSWRRMEIRNFSDFCALLLECGFSLGGGNPKGVFSLLAPGCLEQQEDSPIRSHTGDPDTDPWEWRMRVLEERQDLAYGKVFFRASGYIARQWYPSFLAVRRRGETLKQAYAAGRVNRAAKKVYEVLYENGPVPFHELKFLRGCSKEESRALEPALLELQMGMFITIGGRAQKKNRQGQPYGWNSTVFSTVEDFWSQRGLTLPFLDPDKAYEDIRRQVYRLNPLAQAQKAEQFIKG